MSTEPKMELTTRCGRCQKEIEGSHAKAEVCWYCHAYLCYPCWDEFGHCGHPEADETNRRARGEI